MDKSIFDILGPVMIGPSSSHTAGAARIGRIARGLVNGNFEKARCLLVGSFADTYKGHGTDIAITAGLLGIRESDERLKDAFAIAKQCGKMITFETGELNDVPENTVKIFFDGGRRTVTGASLGGGSVAIIELDGFKVNITGSYPALIIKHIDKSGIISEVSGVLAAQKINIGAMNVSRINKGSFACMVIECDGVIPQSAIDEILKFPDIHSAAYITTVY